MSEQICHNLKLLLRCSFLAAWMLVSGSCFVLAQDTWDAPAFTDTLKSAFKSDEKMTGEGKKLYENMCWNCHGLEGKGDGPAAVAINPKPADHTGARVQQQKDGNIYWKISTGKGAMQPYGKTLTSKQRWALVSYIRQLGATSLIQSQQQ